MPAILAMFFGGLATVTGSLVGRVLVGLGISYATYTGLSALMSGVESQVSSMFDGVPTLALQVLGTLQLDTCVNIYLSAFTARMILMGVGPTGAITRMVIK